jgi:cytochrome c1
LANRRDYEKIEGQTLMRKGKFLLVIGIPIFALMALRRFASAALWLVLGFALRRFTKSIPALNAAEGESGQPPEQLQAPAEAAAQRGGSGLASFTKALLWMGILLGLFVVGDLVARGFQREIEVPVWETSEDETDLGRQAIIVHGCGGCHVIPGIRHATGRVGPQLNGFRDQIYIAGMLPNVPENLMLWIQNPQGINPKTAMPNLQVSEAEAREIAVYLYAQP